MMGEWEFRERGRGRAARMGPLWEEALKGCRPTVHLFITELMAFKGG